LTRVTRHWAGLSTGLEFENQLDVTVFVLDPIAHLIWVHLRQRARESASHGWWLCRAVSMVAIDVLRVPMRWSRVNKTAFLPTRRGLPG
jgi:hypothetical protein